MLATVPVWIHAEKIATRSTELNFFRVNASANPTSASLSTRARERRFRTRISEQSMSATFPKRLVGAAVVISVLAGCAYRPESAVVDSERGPILVENAPRKSPILQFCEDYEM